MITQLDRDLARQIDSKLKQWTQDSFELFAMVYREDMASVCIIEALLSNLCAGFVASDASDDNACQLVRQFMERARQAKARITARRER
jgi:hypothetical protein